jgi:hypothetical protein
MDASGIKKRGLPLFASAPRAVLNAAACRYSQLRHSLTQHAMHSSAAQVPANSADQFSPKLSHPIRRRQRAGLAVGPASPA